MEAAFTPTQWKSGFGCDDLTSTFASFVSHLLLFNLHAIFMAPVMQNRSSLTLGTWKSAMGRVRGIWLLGGSSKAILGTLGHSQSYTQQTLLCEP